MLHEKAIKQLDKGNYQKKKKRKKRHGTREWLSEDKCKC